MSILPMRNVPVRKHRSSGPQSVNANDTVLRPSAESPRIAPGNSSAA
jgi:hypothetical protein